MDFLVLPGSGVLLLNELDSTDKFTALFGRHFFASSCAYGYNESGCLVSGLKSLAVSLRSQSGLKWMTGRWKTQPLCKHGKMSLG